MVWIKQANREKQIEAAVGELTESWVATYPTVRRIRGSIWGPLPGKERRLGWGKSRPSVPRSPPTTRREFPSLTSPLRPPKSLPLSISVPHTSRLSSLQQLITHFGVAANSLLLLLCFLLLLLLLPQPLLLPLTSQYLDAFSSLRSSNRSVSMVGSQRRCEPDTAHNAPQTVCRSPRELEQLRDATRTRFTHRLPARTPRTL